MLSVGGEPARAASPWLTKARPPAPALQREGAGILLPCAGVRITCAQAAPWHVATASSSCRGFFMGMNKSPRHKNRAVATAGNYLQGRHRLVLDWTSRRLRHTARQ